MTITKERLLKIQHWRETYGAGSNVMLPAEEAEELARIALASLEAEPFKRVNADQMRRVCLEANRHLDKYGAMAKEVNKLLSRHPAALPAPVDKEFIPKNLDKALGVVGVALPESKEEFNFQIERWIHRLIDRVIRYADEFKEQPVPVVPEEMPMPNTLSMYAVDAVAAIAEVRGWNSCRAAMLHAGNFRENANSSTNNFRKITETSTNSPVIPDDWVMVPKEPTQAMIKAWLSEVANWRGHVAGYKAALAAAPQHEVK